MSLLRTYGGSYEMGREELEAWLNQIEDITVATVTVIKVHKATKMTHAIVDLELGRPSKRAAVQMGHLPVGGSPIRGQAFVLKQAMDVTIHRP